MSVKKSNNEQLILGGFENEDQKNVKTHKKSVKSPTRKNDFFVSLVENGSVGFFIIKNDVLQYCNSRFAKIFGYKKKEELIGKPVQTFIEPDRWNSLKKELEQFDSSSDSFTLEFTGIKKDNTKGAFQISFQQTSYQNTPAYQGSIDEVTDQKRAEVTLRENEKRFRTFFEGSPDGIFVLDKKGQILDVNLAGSLMMGMGRSEIIGKHFLELVNSEDKSKVNQDIPGWLSGEINFYQVTLNSDRGDKMPVELRIRVNQYTQDVALMLFARDISDRIKVSESFMESQRTLSNFMSNLPGMAYRCLNDKDWTMEFVSQGSLSLTGYQPDDLINNQKIAFNEIIHKDFRKYVWDKIQQAVENKEPFQIEYKIKTADGKDKWVWEQGRGVFSEGSQLVALEGIITDISQLKGAELALRESEKRFRSLIENVPSIAVQGYDVNHNIFFWNKASEVFFGYQKEEAIGQKIEELIYPHYLRNKMNKAIEDWIHKGKVIPFSEISLEHKEGYHFEVHSSHVMLRNIHGKPEMYCLNIDLTEQNEAKKELQKSLYKLKRALEGTIRALTSAVEMRDPYTAGHQQGVAKLAIAIAGELGLTENQIEGLKVSSLLHDIGNLNVPAEILNRPGKLTELEYILLKTHPQFGFEILRTINFPWPVAQVVLQHHERLDGSGYPQGLKNEQIMLEAKIIAVADVVEPISSHRPYRPALGIEKALEEIENGKGTLYDPDVVDACIKLFREKGFTFDNPNSN